MLNRIRIFVLSFFLFLPLFGQAGIVDFFPDFHGFLEYDYGTRWLNDNYTKHPRLSLHEQRLQLKMRHFPEWPQLLYDWQAIFNFKSDFVVDEYFSGKTSFELREFNLVFSPWQSIDLKIGRQILTWGTGNYLFINDVFPKDYVSFFIGRDDEYLKAPSWAIKLSWFADVFWSDFIWIPYFEPNINVRGDRLSFYDTLLMRQAGRESDWFYHQPGNQIENSQYALRIYRQINSWEWALYYYHGYYLNPKGYKNPYNFEVYYPRLDVYGASLRGPFLDGIGNIEIGYYSSLDDLSGENRLIQNSQFKLLLGYSRDFPKDLNLGFQYFWERILDYDDYRQALLPEDISYDQDRHLITLSCNKKFFNQTLTWNNFLFFSISDRDVYFRSSLTKKLADNIQLTCGVNIFFGEDDYTEFGQLEGNNNFYLRLRYSF